MSRKNQATWIEASERWRISVQRDGIRRSFYSPRPGTRGKIEAERKADKWLDAGSDGDANTRCEILLDQWLAHLAETTSRSHVEQYGFFVKNWIKPVFGRKHLDALNELDIERVLQNAARADLAEKTVKSIRTCELAFVKYCRKRHLTTFFPEDIKLPRRLRQSDRRAMSAADLRTLFSTDETLFNQRVQQDFYIYAYRFLVLTGARPGELAALTEKSVLPDRVKVRGAIDGRNGEKTLGKNANAIRDLSLSTQARLVLLAQKKMLHELGVRSPYLFPDRSGSVLCQSVLRHNLARFCKHNGMNIYRPYELRHTFCSLNTDMPEKIKKLVMGHSDSMDTEGVYGHEIDGDLETAAACVDEAIAKVLGA